MRVLHTSDWHAGKSLYRKSLLPDLQHSLAQMMNIIEKEKIELVLICGDIFDSYNPPSEAEEIVYKFFLDLYRLNRQTVLISGNHDNSNMVKSIKELVKLANVTAFDKPSLNNHHTLQINGNSVNIAGVSYPSERIISSIVNIPEGQADRLSNYSQKVAEHLKKMGEGFPNNNGINILCSHLMVDGSTVSGTERAFSIGSLFGVTGQSFPESANYVALGHVHKAQEIKKSSVKTFYSGSPIQMDFGEADHEKGFYIVDLEKDSIAKSQFFKLEQKNPLIDLKVKRNELDSTLKKYKNHQGYIKLHVLVENYEHGLADEIRKELGSDKVLWIGLENTNQEVKAKEMKNLNLIEPLEVFREYYLSRGIELKPELETALIGLMEEIKQ